MEERQVYTDVLNDQSYLDSNYMLSYHTLPH